MIFGKIENDQMIPALAGQVVAKTWLELPKHYPLIQVDEFIVMPNHFHGIVVITDQGARGKLPLVSLSEVVRRFKSDSARKINLILQTPHVPVWQRNNYEHIVRSNEELTQIRRYIVENPLRWALDRENPNRQPSPVGAGR